MTRQSAPNEEVCSVQAINCPKLTKSAEVHPVGQVKADFSSVPLSAFHTFAITCRGNILAADVTVDMMFASADIKFEVVFEEESYGNTQIEY